MTSATASRLSNTNSRRASRATPVADRNSRNRNHRWTFKKFSSHPNTEGGKKKKISKLEALAKSFVAQAVKGDKTMTKHLVDFVQKLGHNAFEDDGVTFFRITKDIREELKDLAEELNELDE